MSTPDPADYKLLLLRISDGDENAFRQLFTRYAPILHLHLSRFITSSDIKEDIIQETFLRVWLHRDRLPGLENWWPWVLRIAYNRVFTYLRDKGIHERAMRSIEEIPSESQVYNAAEMNMLKQVIAKAIDNLPPQQKKIYVLSREQGMQISQISETLKLSPQTIKNSLGLALKSIRLFLEENGHRLILLSLLFRI